MVSMFFDTRVLRYGIRCPWILKAQIIWMNLKQRSDNGVGPDVSVAHVHYAISMLYDL